MPVFPALATLFPAALATMVTLVVYDPGSKSADVVTVVSVPENVSSVAAPLDGVIVHLALVMSEALKPEGKAYEQVIFPP